MSWFEILAGGFIAAIGSVPREQKTARSTNPDRLYIFHGTFASELEATSYCLDAPSKRKPEPINRDFSDVKIDTSKIEIIFGPKSIEIALPMITANTDDLYGKIGSDNTIIMITEDGFADMPGSFNDTPRLKYAGAFDVT